MVEASRWPNTSYTTWAEVVTWATGLVCTATPPVTTVTYDGSCYKCNTSHTAGASFDATKWTQIARGVPDSLPASSAYAKTLHADDFDSISDAIAALEDGYKLLLQGGKTYTHSGGAFTSFPNNFCFDSDNGIPWVIDFSGNAAWHPTGLFGISSAVEAATEQALTANLTASDTVVQASSATAVGTTVTMNTSGAHGLTTGDYVFIRFGSAAPAGQAAYCTERDSDEGQSLDKPVQVTVVDTDTFTYTAYSGTPDATMTIFPFIYKNNQVVFVADSSDYAVGDLVFIESDETFTSFTGTQTMQLAELNEVGWIIDSTKIWLREPAGFSYATAQNAKITKVTKKTPVFMNGKIIGNGVNPTKPYYTYSDIGILCHLLHRPKLINMQFEQCDFMGNWMRSCYYPYLENCLDTKPIEDAAGRTTGKIETEYGFAFGNATRGYLAVDCESRGGRHGFDETSTATYKGMTYGWTLVRPRCYEQWSTNIDTHGTAWRGRIIDPVVHGGDGIACRNGSIICTGIRARNVMRAFSAYGRCVDIVVSVDEADFTFDSVVRIAPSTDIATPTPDSTGIKILYVNSKNGGNFGVRLSSPDGHKFIAPYIGPVQCDDINTYPLYLYTTGTGEILAPTVGPVTANNFGSYVAYINKVTDGVFNGIYGRKSGSFTICVVSDATATRNTFNNVRGTSTSGGTVTKFSMPATSSGNFTDSLEYESLVIASGAITKKFRNVPLTIVDTEAAAASDDLDTINGLSYGDYCAIRTNNSARDVVVKAGTGNILRPRDRTLRSTSEVDVLQHTGTYLVHPDYAVDLKGSKTYDAPSLADGAGTTTDVTVTGAAVGDIAWAAFSITVQGMIVTAEVSAADTVTVRIQNETGGAVDLASTTLTAFVTKVS